MPVPRRPALAVPVATLLLLVGACADDGGAAAPGATTTTTASHIGELPDVTLRGGVYEVPDPVPDGDPGALLAASEVDEPWVPPGARAWRILYRSTALDGGLVAVSGVLVAPRGPVPDGGRPVLSWAHGTMGVADVCAPSLEGRAPVPFLEALVDDGWVVVATDYEGLGTPGVHPYLVGRSQARSVLDAARAARLAGGGDRVAVWGHSQGGHAALWAAEVAGGYAPELDLLGVVAGAPPADLAALLDHVVGSPPAFGFLAMAAYAYDAAYPDVSLEELFTEAARTLVPTLEQQCVPEVMGPWAAVAGEALVARPLQIDGVARRVAENTPGQQRPEAPVLIVQGDADPIVPVPTVDAFVGRLCALGATVEYARYEGGDHTSVIATSRELVLGWLAARRDGEPAPSTACP